MIHCEADIEATNGIAYNMWPIRYIHFRNVLSMIGGAV